MRGTPRAAWSLRQIAFTRALYAVSAADVPEIVIDCPHPPSTRTRAHTGATPRPRCRLPSTLRSIRGVWPRAPTCCRPWYIPRKRRPNFFTWRLRGLGLLVMLGLLMILSTAAAGFVTAQTAGAVEVLGGILLALAVNLLLFFCAFRLLTSDEIHTRDLIPGVIVAAVLWQILQHVGGYYVDHVVRHAKETSGLFAFVLGLLAWLYLGAQLTLVAAEINVVRARQLWPRSFYSDPLLDADKRALTASAEVEERIDEQNVEVSFDAPE